MEIESFVLLFLAVAVVYGAYHLGKKIGIEELERNLIDDTHLEDTLPYVAYNQKRYDKKRLYVKKLRQEEKLRHFN